MIQPVDTMTISPRYSFLLSMYILAACVSPTFAQPVQQASSRTIVDTVSAPGFRIDADMYADLAKPPLNQVKTLFTENQTIEIDDRNGVCRLLDFQKQWIVVLNTRERRVTEIAFRNIESQLQGLIAQAKVPEIGPPSKPTPDTLRFGDENLFYQVKTIQPPVEQMAIRYSEFADWATQLAAIFPPYKPPFLRLKVNEYLLEHRLLPSEIQLTTRTAGKLTDVHVHLIVSDKLTNEDRMEIERINRLRDEFQIISPAEFFKAMVR